MKNFWPSIRRKQPLKSRRGGQENYGYEVTIGTAGETEFLSTSR